MYILCDVNYLYIEHTLILGVDSIRLNAWKPFWHASEVPGRTKAFNAAFSIKAY